MIACVCFGLIEGGIAALSIFGGSGIVAWFTVKYNKHCCKEENCNGEY